MKRPAIKCRHCSGLGVRSLASPYWLTLRLLGTKWSSTDAVLRAHLSFAVERTALINRLNKLVAYGLVGRRLRTGSKTMEWRRYQ